VDEAWRLLHLIAAAYWLGGLIALAMLAVVAHRLLEAEAFRALMTRAGRAFLAGSVVAWALIAVSGVSMAAGRLHNLGELQSTGWGRTLELKSGIALVAIILTAVHSVAGARSSSTGWVATSRVLSPLILVTTLAIYYLAVRLAEG
jgi:putative copper export protein